jgi:predicted HAD superfamily hydrolase
MYENGEDIFRSNIGGVKNLEGYIDGGKWGIIDMQSGRELIAPKYDYVWGFTEGLALVTVDGIYDPVRKSFVGGKYGFINPKGVEIIPIQFNVANPFKNGVANVTLNGVSYKINVNGEKVY